MKPFSLEDLESAVRRIFAAPKGAEPSAGRTAELPFRIITEDEKILKLLKLLQSIAKSRASVLIQGESGTVRSCLPDTSVPIATGRSALHRRQLCRHSGESPGKRDVRLREGRFYGAHQRKIGKFELANTGTLLLDEISEMDVNFRLNSSGIQDRK